MTGRKCVVCRKEEGKYGLKNSMICHTCLARMPSGIQEHYWEFTGRQLRRLSRQICDREQEILYEIGSLCFGNQMISVNRTGFCLSNIKDIRLNFHPHMAGNARNTVAGIITVVMELKRPRLYIEEPIVWNDVVIGYEISGAEIRYYYPYSLKVLFEQLEKCLEEKGQDMALYLQKACNAIHEKEEENRKKQEAVRKKEEQRAQARRAEEKARRQKAQEESRNKEIRDKCGDAMILFQLDWPYTMEELKKRQRDLLKKHHPDAGGSEETTKEINKAYELLSKYAK